MYTNFTRTINISRRGLASVRYIREPRIVAFSTRSPSEQLLPRRVRFDYLITENVLHAFEYRTIALRLVIIINSLSTSTNHYDPVEGLRKKTPILPRPRALRIDALTLYRKRIRFPFDRYARLSAEFSDGNLISPTASGEIRKSATTTSSPPPSTNYALTFARLIVNTSLKEFRNFPYKNHATLSTSACYFNDV